jgi:hypothetical protein
MCRGSEIPERRISRGCPRNVNVPYPEKTKAKKAGRHFALIIRTVYRGVGRTRSRTGSDTGLERNTNRSDPTLYQLPTYSVNSFVYRISPFLYASSLLNRMLRIHGLHHASACLRVVCVCLRSHSLDRRSAWRTGSGMRFRVQRLTRASAESRQTPWPTETTIGLKPPSVGSVVRKSAPQTTPELPTSGA